MLLCRIEASRNRHFVADLQFSDRRNRHGIDEMQRRRSLRRHALTEQSCAHGVLTRSGRRAVGRDRVPNIHREHGRPGHELPLVHRERHAGWCGRGRSPNDVVPAQYVDLVLRRFGKAHRRGRRRGIVHGDFDIHAVEHIETRSLQLQRKRECCEQHHVDRPPPSMRPGRCAVSAPLFITGVPLTNTWSSPSGTETGRS